MLGDACAEFGRTTDALRHLHQALALAEGTGDIAGRDLIER
ncbi:hypothetical protein [Actinoallomurus sp. NPDC050550]